MIKLRHYTQRIRQRGIKESVAELLLQFGFRDGEEVVLTRDTCKLISYTLGNIKRTLDKMSEKGGYKLIIHGDKLVTAYSFNSFKEGRARMSKKSHPIDV